MTLILSRGIQQIFTVKAHSHGATAIVTAIMTSSQNGLQESLLNISIVSLIDMDQLTDPSLDPYSPNPQQSVKQWTPFANDNEAKDHKS